MSFDQQNWFGVQATGTVSVVMSNTTPNGSAMSIFDTEITQMKLVVPSGPTGSFMVRESPTKQSLGRHTIMPDPRGYRVSSFFDVFTELSTDGGVTWIPADRSIRMSASAPAAAPGTLFISKIRRRATPICNGWVRSPCKPPRASKDRIRTFPVPRAARC